MREAHAVNRRDQPRAMTRRPTGICPARGRTAPAAAKGRRAAGTREEAEGRPKRQGKAAGTGRPAAVRKAEGRSETHRPTLPPSVKTVRILRRTSEARRREGARGASARRRAREGGGGRLPRHSTLPPRAPLIILSYSFSCFLASATSQNL